MKKVVAYLDNYRRVAQEQDQLAKRVKQQSEAKERQRAQYSEAKTAAEDVVRGKIIDILTASTSPFYMQDVDVDVDAGKYQSRITVRYGEARKFDDDVPLVWTWQAVLSDDGVDRKTSSWSGMNAVTKENVATLQMTVKALQALASVDDQFVQSLMQDNTVDVQDYVTEEVDNYSERNYDERKLEALAGEDVFVEGRSSDTYSTKYSNHYFKILRDTGKQYVVEDWILYKPIQNPQYARDASFEKYETRRYRKDTLLGLVKTPVVPVTYDEITAIVAEFND